MMLMIRVWAAPTPEAMSEATHIYQEKRYSEAVPMFRALIAQADEDATLCAHLNLYLGEALRQCGKLDEALAALTSAHQATLTNPESASLKRVSAEALAKALSAAGRGEDSDRLFNEALTATPADGHSLLRLTWAESAFQAGRHAVALRETKLAGKTPAALHLEGKIAHATGRYARAAQLFREGLGQLSDSQADAGLSGHFHAGLAAAACRLGDAPSARAGFAAARDAYERCGEVAALKSLAKSEAVAALFLGHDPTASLPVLREAAAVFANNDESGPAAAARSNLGAALHLAGIKTGESALLLEARECLDRANPPLPLAHPLHRQIALNRWCLALDEGRQDAATMAAARAADSALALLPDLLAAASEQERLAFRRLVDEISPLLQSAFAQPERVEKTSDVILTTHGAVFESELLALQIAAQATPAARDSWFAARQALGEAWFHPETTQEILDTLRAKVAQATSSTAALRESVSILSSRAVTSALPAESALVVYTLYQHYAGAGVFEPRYAALVIAPGTEPRIVALDYEGDISRQKKSLALAISAEGMNDAAAARSLAALGKSLWSPVSALLPAGTRRVFVCPDGTLNTVPFALLTDGDSALIENGPQLQFLATPRALLRGAANASEVASGAWLAVDAGSTWTGEAQGNGNPQLTKILRHAGRDRLPNAAAEVAMIQNHHAQTRILSGSSASESKCRAALDPKADPCIRVWHFAGHGGFDFSATPDPHGSDASWEGPLFPAALARSGLLFPEIEAPLTDACLFAAELALLDLRHVQLASFASCHSGAGAAAAREGLFDLARAGHAAGIRDVLVAAWGVSDEASPEFFRVFYAAISAGADSPTAAWDAQAALWKSTRSQRGIARAVLRAGPFRLVRSR